MGSERRRLNAQAHVGRMLKLSKKATSAKESNKHLLRVV